MTKRTTHVLDVLQRNVPWVMLAVLCIIFSLITDNFFTVRNIVNILNQNAFVVVVSLGIAPIMMSGAIDLSIGYQMSIIAVVSAMALVYGNLPIPVVFVIAILLGIGMNVLNAMISHKLDLTLFMVSVAAMNIYMGVSYTISNAQIVNKLPASFKYLGQGFVGPVPFPVILAAALFVIMNFFMTRTYWGRYIYALGGNTEASRLAGINVLGVKLMIAGICGVFVGLSSLMLIARLGSAQSTMGPGTEFDVITGVLVGGVSLRGGEGKLHCVLAGILIMAIFSNGMQMAGMGVYVQYIVKGLIMILAISFDVYQYKRRQKSKNTHQEAA